MSSDPRARFDSLHEGLVFAPMTIGPITRTHIVRYAGASGDFNPLHHDDEYARSLGNPSIFAMGMFPAGVLGTAVTHWLGVGCVRRFKVRFAARVWPGDTLTLEGTVSRKELDGGLGTVGCSLRVVNQAGEVVIYGEADAAYPIAGGPPPAGQAVGKHVE